MDPGDYGLMYCGNARGRGSTPARLVGVGRAVRLVVALVVGLAVGGCVGLRCYNKSPEDYARRIPVDDRQGVADLAIIEFDDRGELWDLAQLASAVDTIEQRSAASTNGILVVVYLHGWKHNADWQREGGGLRVFAAQLAETARGLTPAGKLAADHVVGIYLGWRGRVLRGPQSNFSFWNRRAAAERVASINMRETLFRVVHAVKSRPQSKVILYGHSMGGMILGKTMGPSLTTLLMLNGEAGTRLPVDMAVLANPALEALMVSQFVDFLKRHGAVLMLESHDGSRRPARGPLMASITTEADRATGFSFPLGVGMTVPFGAYRKYADPRLPSQRHLAMHTDGHVDRLVSHTADVVDGKVVLTEVPNRYNDTPYWVIRVSKAVCGSHGDIGNRHLNALLVELTRLREVYDPSLTPVMVLTGSGDPL